MSAAAGYRAAVESAAVIDRSSRTRLALAGKAPEQILTGLVSGRIPAPAQEVGDGVWKGRAEGSALLTPKGRMVAELRILRPGPPSGDGFLLDLPEACRDAALAHLRKFVPPRLATIEELSDRSAMLTVVGPGAARSLVRESGLPVDAAALNGLADGDLLHVALPGGGTLTIVRTEEVASPAFDLLGRREELRELDERLRAAGAASLSPAEWETLRIEAGRPAFGADLDDTTIPVEAGIHGRVVDYGKGCFTGQEVLIRIRDRGHVNRRLCRVHLGGAEPPAPGTELFRSGEERAVGKVTSAARSPRAGETLALGYVRREVGPGSALRLGAPDGLPAVIRDLE